MPKKAFFGIAEAKRDKVLSCALREFSKYKYHEASLNRIVKTAAIPWGSFYQYFEDKEDLYFHLFEIILQSELQEYYKQYITEVPTDPMLFYQMMLKFHLHMLSDSRYQGFFRNLFLCLDYHFGCRYNEIIDRQRTFAIEKLGLDGSPTGERIKETLSVFSLVTRDLLAMKVVEGLPDETVMKKFHARINILKLNCE